MTRTERKVLEQVNGRLEDAYRCLREYESRTEGNLSHERVQVLLAKCDISDLIHEDTRRCLS
jgi:hypothetical protein